MTVRVEADRLRCDEDFTGGGTMLGNSIDMADQKVDGTIGPTMNGLNFTKDGTAALPSSLSDFVLSTGLQTSLLMSVALCGDS